jgi:hypothetical protein
MRIADGFIRGDRLVMERPALLGWLEAAERQAGTGNRRGRVPMR